MALENGNVAEINAAPSSKLEGEQLIDALKKQVEFYFSRQNLPTDAYLRSQMNSRMFVPIDVIARFRKVKSLTEDKKLLLKVMKQCSNIVVDETDTMVRPILEIPRTTLILRDIPFSTKKEKVEKIFDNLDCKKSIVSIRPEIGDNWYVTFKNQDDCISTHLFLMDKKFADKPIKCRVKSENMFRSMYMPGAAGSGGAGGAAGAKRGSWTGHGPPPNFPTPRASYPMHGYQHPMQTPQNLNHPGQTNNQRKTKRGKQKNSAYQNQFQKSGQKALHNSKKVYIKYPQPCLKYSREQMAEIVKKLSKEGFTKPKNMPKAGSTPVIAEKPAADSQLLEPMPVMYPSSSSPYWAAQPHHSGTLPLLDINTGHLGHPIEKKHVNNSSKQSKEPVTKKNMTKSRVYAPKKGTSRGSNKRANRGRQKYVKAQKKTVTKYVKVSKPKKSNVKTKEADVHKQEVEVQ